MTSKNLTSESRAPFVLHSSVHISILHINNYLPLNRITVDEDQTDSIRRQRLDAVDGRGISLRFLIRLRVWIVLMCRGRDKGKIEIKSNDLKEGGYVLSAERQEALCRRSTAGKINLCFHCVYTVGANLQRRIRLHARAFRGDAFHHSGLEVLFCVGLGN